MTQRSTFLQGLKINIILYLKVCWGYVYCIFSAEAHQNDCKYFSTINYSCDYILAISVIVFHSHYLKIVASVNNIDISMKKVPRIKHVIR